MLKFKKERTADAPFKLITGKKVDVPMMNKKEELNYAEDDMIQVLEMPYAGNELSMVIFLPKEEEAGLVKLEWNFKIENVKRWLSMLRKQIVNVSMPRFKTTSRFYLEEILANMGMPDAFTPGIDFGGRADFSGMTGNKELNISKVIHKAFVDVNEEGTEAAAATAVTMAKISGAPPPKPKSFKADHPFIFIIRDKRSGSILFCGRIMDPRE